MTEISIEKNLATLTKKTEEETETIEMIEEEIEKTEVKEKAIEIPETIGITGTIEEITEITEITGGTTIEAEINNTDQKENMLRRERTEVTENLLNSLSWQR